MNLNIEYSIANKYNIIRKLNEGKFGTIYECENMRTKEKVAIKMELSSSPLISLKNEAKIYQYLGNVSRIPRLKWFGKFNDYTYLVMDLLGLSLKEYIRKNKKIHLEHILNISIQMLLIIRTIHYKDLLHRDIKPDNFMFNVNEETNKLYLIDFGLAKRYMYDGKHISENNISSLIGTPNYVSLNVHNGYEPSRRDDIESCIYVIIYMLLGETIWASINIEKMIEYKKNMFNGGIVPEFITKMLSIVRNMTFEEEPDYDLLINMLKDEMNYNCNNNH